MSDRVEIEGWDKFPEWLKAKTREKEKLWAVKLNENGGVVDYKHSPRAWGAVVVLTLKSGSLVSIRLAKDSTKEQHKAAAKE